MQRAESAQAIDHVRDDLDELLALTRRDVIEAAALLFNAELGKQFQQHSMALGGAIVALFVVAIAGVTGENQHAVRSLTECLQDKLRVDATAAHDPDGMDIRRTS